MISEAERLKDILEAIERIEKYAAEGKGRFLQAVLMWKPYGRWWRKTFLN